MKFHDFKHADGRERELNGLLQAEEFKLKDVQSQIAKLDEELKAAKKWKKDNPVTENDTININMKGGDEPKHESPSLEEPVTK